MERLHERTAGYTGGRSSADRAPVPPAATRLLARSDGELVAAQLAGDDDERFVHAHLAALRAGAALLAVVGRPVRRRTPRSVWDLVALAEPDLASWAAFFAAGAATRSAIEAGRRGGVDQARADATAAAAEDFQDAVRRRIGAPEAAAGGLLDTTVELCAS